CIVGDLDSVETDWRAHPCRSHQYSIVMGDVFHTLLLLLFVFSVNLATGQPFTGYVFVSVIVDSLDVKEEGVVLVLVESLDHVLDLRKHLPPILSDDHLSCEIVELLPESLIRESHSQPFTDGHSGT
ncbi:hypothetical protein PMAYCL1PPCAC_12338, partial [Pristionchus mayeri]